MYVKNIVSNIKFSRSLQGKATNTRMSYKVEVSYMEIYCEKVRDLLCPKG